MLLKMKNKSIEELVKLSKQNPKEIYKKGNVIISNGTPFTVKKQFNWLATILFYFFKSKDKITKLFYKKKR